ncbi:bHLH transcription factor Myc [Bombus vancouverensis nearcticus]|uniref:bHLH transcription factor Myc n=1 Tax=Bombus vancouverensis nearcticus TaxID=2705178 RepID=UPI00143B490E|nr:transcriptional regulator Myc-like [Bombus vancouverensis nearcticus]XP_033206817.1 transcriptional regulator Myc-like [Bombus vancouverensis nearcticus]
MPVPVWDSSDLGLLGEPLDTATVVSDDIWKKFDLPDFLSIDHRADVNTEMYCDRTLDDGILSDPQYDKTCLSREIRHHDCMWAGLCISKEHNRTLPAKKESLIQKKVPAGRSLLISRANTAFIGTSLAVNQQQAQQLCRARNLESDGESTRPDTPQSSSSDTETEDEGPFFRHDQINIHEKLSECISAPTTKTARVSQNKRKTGRRGRRKEQDQCQVHRETNIRNTLSDHCYHLNQSFSKNLEHLGVQTPSDSEEEEIDVVSFDKPCRPAVLPTNPSLADQQHFQLTVNTAFKEKPPGSRPRGRPPSNPARKRAAQVEQKPAKRARHRTCQRRNKVGRTMSSTSVSSSSVSSSPSMRSTTSRSSSDDELDTEKRREHNNMERQRRIELRNAFEELRILVPAVEKKEKAPKVAILRQASAYLASLTSKEMGNAAKVADLRRQQEKLRASLSYLRRSLAMTR